MSNSCGGGWHHGGGGGSPQMQAYGWRDTVQGLMAGHWYSTQGDGHCNETSGTCGWKTVEVKKVVNANCVNDQIVHAVQARNASCFDALANKTDRTTDGWITCMFEGLLGDRKKNAPAIAGGMLNTFPQVAQLRQKILDLWVGAFESNSPASGGCPPVDSQNVADGPEVKGPAGVETVSLFLKDGVSVSDMTNRNSADAKGMVLSTVYDAVRGKACADGTDACDMKASLFAGGFEGGVVTAASVEVNTMFGQFGACKRDQNDNAWHCEADWECWCEDDWGGNGDDNSNPCLRSDGDDGDPCMCNIWGGCGGGHWDGCPDDGCPAVADSALTVGRHSLAGVDALVGDVAVLKGIAAEAHEFSTTAGGKCPDGEDEEKSTATPDDPNADNPFSDLCTWAPVSTADWKSADASCLEAAVLSAVEASASQCLKEAEAETARGGAGWLVCVGQKEAVEAGEMALVAAFDACAV